MPPYSQHGQVISTEMTLQTHAYPTTPREHFYSQLRQKHLLRLAYRRFIVFISTTISNNVIISTAHARGSLVDRFLAEPLIMVPRPTVDPYVDTTDPIVTDKRRGMRYGMEPEGLPRVGEYIHFQWYDDKKCYSCRVVYYHPEKDYTTVIHGKRKQYTIELVSMRNTAWDYVVDAHKTKRGEDPYDPTAYVGRILFFKDIPLDLGSNPTTPTAFVCKYMAPNNNICLQRKGPCRHNTTTWL